MTKRILVGLDGSPREKGVLQEAITQAERFDARLIPFRAVALPTELPAEALSVTPDALGGLLVDTARRQLQRLVEASPLRYFEPVHVQLGVPWRAICEAARRDEVDLVVIGSHGYGGVDRLLGTTAAKVVDHAPCSVLIIRTT